MPIRVSCAVVVQAEKVLAVRRGSGMKRAGKWEFPGGKLEQGESAEQSLIREIREELHLEISLVRALEPVIHRYPEIEIELIPFLAKPIAGTLQLTEHDAFEWLEVAQLSQLDWAEADLPIVQQVMQLEHG